MPITIITTKSRRKDAKPRYRARWTNPYERGAKPVYKVHWDTAWLREWGRQMDAAARDAKLNRPEDVAASVLFAMRQPPGCEIKELVVTSSWEGSWP